MATNPYVQQIIAGFNASPPPNDGTQSEANRLDWDKHVDKLATPVKDLSENIDDAVNDAFAALLITDDVAVEDAIVGFDRFSNIRAYAEVLCIGLKKRLTTLEATSDARATNENSVVANDVLGNRDPVSSIKISRLFKEVDRTRALNVQGESSVVSNAFWS